MERILEVCVLSAAVWPLLRLFFEPAFWRKLRIFPRVAAALVGMLAVYVLLVACLAIYAPVALRVVAI